MRDFLMHTYDLLMKGGAAAAGFLYGIVNGESRSAILLVALMTADYLSGIAAAALGKSAKSAHGRLSSEAGARGLLKKAVILLVVGLAWLLDWFINEGNAMFTTAVIWFYISNEGISLVENLALCGVPIPAKFKVMLEKLAADEAAKEAAQTEEAAKAAGADAPAEAGQPDVASGAKQNG